jgi:hypothetical protein
VGIGALRTSSCAATVTLYAAQILSVGDKVGALEPGAIADVIVTNGDPPKIATKRCSAREGCEAGEAGVTLNSGRNLRSMPLVLPQDDHLGRGDLGSAGEAHSHGVDPRRRGKPRIVPSIPGEDVRAGIVLARGKSPDPATRQMVDTRLDAVVSRENKSDLGDTVANGIVAQLQQRGHFP